MSIWKDSTDEEIAPHIKALKREREGSNERRWDLAVIGKAALKKSLGAFWMRSCSWLAVGALCRECLRLSQEVKELQAKLADKP
jgi:hypothetical protein